MKESELEIQELEATRQSMSAIGRNKKAYYPYYCSDIFVYMVANAETDKELQKRITGFLKERGVNVKPNAKNCPELLKAELGKMNEKDAYSVLASLHPDRELIEKYGKLNNKELNACGCMSATDEEASKPKSEKEISTANALITAGVIVAGLSIITAILLKD